MCISNAYPLLSIDTYCAGMIWNANHILELALSPKKDGIPKNLFQKAIGICVVSVVEAGFIFSGNVGTGILIRKNPDGSWSNPCAMGLTGVGWGAIFGAQGTCVQSAWRRSWIRAVAWLYCYLTSSDL